MIANVIITVATTIVVVVALLPVCVYLCVKLGTYAYLRARKLFQETEGRDG